MELIKLEKIAEEVNSIFEIILTNPSNVNSYLLQLQHKLDELHECSKSPKHDHLYEELEQTIQDFINEIEHV